MGEYKADDGKLIWVVFHSFDWFGKEQLPVLMQIGGGLTESASELHLNYEKYKGKPKEWFNAWQTERKGIDAVAKELQENPALFKLFSYATECYKGKLRSDIVNGGKNNPDYKGAVGAIITDEPLDSRDVKDSCDPKAKDLLLQQELEGRLEEAFQAIDAAVKKGGEPAVGGFVGFCLKKICEMPEEQRGLFLSVNRGDQSFYDLRDSWFHEYGKPLKRPGDLLSKAKKLYRELNPELKN